MPLARINGTLLHFVHVPKTGGSSVNDYLRAKGTLGLYSRNPVDWARTTPQHMEAAVHAVMTPPGLADHDFIVLRDPIDRMRSEFKYRVKRATRASGVPQRGQGGAMRLDLEDGQHFVGTFDAFVRHALARARVEPRFADNHIRPQADFWRPGLKAFLFEEGMERVFRWIDAVTGTPALPARPHSNRSPAIEVEMSAETRTILRDAYAVDYALIEEVRDARWPAVAAGVDFESPRPALEA